MAAAASIPLFCFGKMLYQSHTKEERYQAYLETVQADTVTQTIEASEAYNERLGADNQIVDPFAGEVYQVDYGVLEDGDGIYGYLSIPKISVLEPVYLGADPYHLELGFGHVAGTDLPVEGKGVRSVIAGHRSGVDKVYFRHLDKLEEGDDLYFDNGKEIIHYKMLPDNEVILPAEWEKLESKTDKNIMTLITCEPLYIYNKRLLVNFERVGVYAKGKDDSSPQIAEEAATAVAQMAFKREGQAKSSVIQSSHYLYMAICGIAIIGIFLAFYRLLGVKKAGK